MVQVAGIITHTTFNKSNQGLVPLCEVVDTPRGVCGFLSRRACVYIIAYEKINDGRKDLTDSGWPLGWGHDGEKDARRGATEKAEVLSEQQTRQTQVCEGALLC